MINTEHSKSDFPKKNLTTQKKDIRKKRHEIKQYRSASSFQLPASSFQLPASSFQLLTHNAFAGKKILTILATVAGLCGFSHGAVTITATESAGNVVYSWTGSINTTGASLALSAGSISAQIRPSNAVLLVYTANSNTNFWAATGPATLGIGDTTKFVTSQSGDAVSFGITAVTGRSLALSQNYVSGTTFSGSSATLNETFSSMGLNVGTYVWTMTGSNDTVTLSVIPEPSTTVLAGLACGLGLFRRRRA